MGKRTFTYSLIQSLSGLYRSIRQNPIPPWLCHMAGQGYACWQRAVTSDLLLEVSDDVDCLLQYHELGQRLAVVKVGRHHLT